MSTKVGQVVVRGVCEYCGLQASETKTETAESPVAMLTPATCGRCGQQVTLRRSKRPAPETAPYTFHPGQK